jgi:hypothetical protein
VKTNFYLQLEFYEGILKGQSKRKPKPSSSSSTVELVKPPKIIRSASLPSIDALHTFKLEPSVDSSPSSSSSSSSQLPPSPRNNINFIDTPRKLSRAAYSLYSDITVGLPKMEEEVTKTGAEEVKEERKIERETQQTETLATSGEVPESVIRQASDFEEISEIHKLMRVHSLPDLSEVAAEVMAGGESMKERRMSKYTSSKSFLKSAKITMLAVEEEN